MYAELRKANPEQAKRFRTKVLKEPHIQYPCDNYDYYENEPIVWKPFRVADEQYNSFDCATEITTIMHRFTEDDEREFREYFWIHFHDPYGDGRDCTGAPFTQYMQFLRCKDRTVIIHHIGYDY